MRKNLNTMVQDEKGFTLVELAVVMVIIGILIGGVLKGQEMIENARVSSTVAQIKATEAAASTFRDMFDAFPGDMVAANTRIGGCAGACIAGDGNGRLAGGVWAGAVNAESTAFYLQLQAADLIGGVNAAGFLPTDISGNSLYPGYTAGGAVVEIAAARAGHYLSLAQLGTTNTVFIKALDAGRIDRKMDDGVATSGSVGAAAAACHAAGVYDEDNVAQTCGVIARIQG